jgi:DNA-binding MarR family transcriptional regulator
MNQKPDQPPSSNDTERIIELFREIQKAFREHFIEQSRQYGLTSSQLHVIMNLKNNPDSTLGELSENLCLSQSTVSGIVNRLVAQGIIRREIPAANRRTVKLSLAPEFDRTNDLLKLKQQYFSDIMKNATSGDIATIIAGLEKFHSLCVNHHKDRSI